LARRCRWAFARSGSQRDKVALTLGNGDTPSPGLSLALGSRRKLLLTLLLLNAVGLRRTRDLRGYTGDALGLLTGRPRAYGYWHTERFLTQVAEVGGAEALTDAFGQWTAQLWQSGVETKQEGSPCFYIDGHRKPVYTDKLIPRRLIGCSGKILGCRALVLLHDEQSHPRLDITARGDQNLTIGLPLVLLRYEQGNEWESHARVIVDREGMAAPFLQDRKRTWSQGGDAPANGSIRRAGELTHRKWVHNRFW
jgi:hypothetical protein